MLGLKLREEFLGTHMPGTAISLRTNDKQGAAEKSPEEILAITYPTADILIALRAISSKQSGSPIVLMGDRGRGKSHIMAVMHHAIASPPIVEKWIQQWNQKTGDTEMISIDIKKGFYPISEPVHNHEYRFLWDLLFDRHPKGEFYRGQFEGLGQPYPPRSLMEKMFTDQPTCLILDEFQTWFAGLPEKDPKAGLPIKQWAFNFIQNLSEISKERPDILLFVVSVLNNQSEAFHQIHRQGPVIIDFRGPSAKQDRLKLLLHRLFENRSNIEETNISSVAGIYANERVNLLFPEVEGPERERLRNEVFAAWPFSPELIALLEDHILLSPAAQETRDMICVLAQVFRSRANSVPIITPADFFVDGDTEEVQTLMDSIASQPEQGKLRQIAQKNLQSIIESGVTLPHAREMVASIWMRSMSPGKKTGGRPSEIHLDITKGSEINVNAFVVELGQLIELSGNIHGDEVTNGPLWFGSIENPRAKVRACAKNNKVWNSDTQGKVGSIVYPGKDIEQIQSVLLHLLVPENQQPVSRIIVLGPSWKTNPWIDVNDIDKPDKWERPVLLVLPDPIDGGSAGISSCLGAWLAKHVQKRRNTVRFLIASGEKGLYLDEEIVFLARCRFLCSKEGWGNDPLYSGLLQEFHKSLRNVLKTKFDRFAVLQKWDYQQPHQCVFEIEKISEQGDKLANEVEARIISGIFDQRVFKDFVLQRAKESDFVGSLLDDLMEPPPPNSRELIPFLGETKTYEFILDIAANGEIVLNVGGTWIGRRAEDETVEDARRYIKGKAFRTGQEMRNVQMGLPQIVGGGTVTAPPTPPPVVTRKPGVDAIDENAVDSGNTKLFPEKPSESIDSSQPDVVTVTPSRKISVKRTEEAGTGINLAGCFEAWGLPASKPLQTTKIEFSGLTVSQVKQILQRIPSTFKANLDITYKEGEDQ